MKTLYLDKRGCNFSDRDNLSELSDIGNYRVTTNGYNVTGKDGNIYFIEFCRWERYQTRTTNKRTGEPLKHPVRELVNYNALYINFSFEKDETRNGRTLRACYANINLAAKIHAKNYSYTKKDILKAVNSISKDTYTDIQFI